MLITQKILMMMDLVPDARTSAKVLTHRLEQPLRTAMKLYQTVPYISQPTKISLDLNLKEKRWFHFCIYWIVKVKQNIDTNLLDKCLRISSTSLNMRVLTIRRSDDFRSVHEFSCIFWTECRSNQSKRHNWKWQTQTRFRYLWRHFGLITHSYSTNNAMLLCGVYARACPLKAFSQWIK